MYRSIKAPTPWQTAPSEITLGDNGVHLWRASLKQPAAVRQQLWPVLSIDEQEKADRFRFAADSDKYVIARGTLRMLLGQYLQCNPGEVQFGYSEYGKPYVQNAAAEHMHFNVSHSGDVALYGLAYKRRVGVDVERMRPLIDEDHFVKCVFSSVEQQTFQALRPFERQDAFFNGWTRKEAFIKAIGLGLSFPLEAFDVSISPGRPAQLLAVHRNGHSHKNWSLADITIATGYKAAYVVEGSTCQAAYFHLEIGNFLEPNRSRLLEKVPVI